MKQNKSPIETMLLSYQLDWVRDNSRFKIGLWSRQTGKSFSTACEAVYNCLITPKDHWVVLSAGERQALEWMEKAKQWAEAFQLAVDQYKEVRESADAVITRSEIRFNNGSRITAIPANPNTARGYSANLILDEFAIHEKPYEIWAAIYPSITNPLKGEKKLRIVSTPKGNANKFAALWKSNEAYSKHKITILDAKTLGLPVDVEALKAGVDDPDIWAQEFMCEFMDNSAVLLPYEMLNACEVEGELCSQVISNKEQGISNNSQFSTLNSQFFIGMDIGRSKDLSVIIKGVKVNGLLWIIETEVLRNMPFAEQLQVLCNKVDKNVQRVCIDASGIGAMLAEEARRKLGSRVEEVKFTVQSKAEMYSGMRRAFEDKQIRIPADRELREDLHSVVRNVSTGGQITYSAPRNADGHSDRAAALALCIRAASGKFTTFKPIAF